MTHLSRKTTTNAVIIILNKISAAIPGSCPSTMPFYAVRKGRKPGIYETWGECQEQIVKFPAAAFKKFATKELAQSFIDGCNHPEEATMDKSSWQMSCKQMFMEKVTTLSKVVTDVNKYIGTLPEDLQDGQPLVAALNEAKADALVAKTSFKHVLDLFGKQEETGSASKRKHDEEDEPAKRVKSSIAEGKEVAVVYTDGACFNNGKSNAQAGIGVWWGENDKRNVSERLSGRQTNNRAEIYAACRAVQQAITDGYDKVEIRTDSQFMISCMTSWIFGWKKNNWKIKGGGPVKNEEELRELDRLCSQINVTWTHVKAHSGIVGNEFADNLANAGARLPEVSQ